MKSVMQNQFASVPQADIPRSKFNRSHGLKSTFDVDYLVPIFIDEAIPGDTHNLSMNAFARLSTPLYPIMDNMFMDTFFFFVPMRLVWSDYYKFFGCQDDPGDSTSYTIPTCPATASTGYSNGGLHDYFGLPTKIPDYSHNNLPIRAYNLIYNEWFRDENLIDSVVVDKDDGPDAATDYTLLKRGKRHDYFTSALPWPQKGDAVELPLGTSATVKFDSTDTTNAARIIDYSTHAGANQQYLRSNSTGSLSNDANTAFYKIDPNTTLYADLSDATAATINELRQAFQIQKIYERDARGGTRYTEIVRSHFGVVSPDGRLQRPEYLGGGSTVINVHPVASTDSGGTDQVGTLGAFGTASCQGHGFVKSFTEHGYIIGLANVRSDITYQQGLDKMWKRSTRWDHYWPALAHIGEQAIYKDEIYCQDPTQDTGSTGTPDNQRVFGYQERYAEYRYKPSRICGVFRSNDTSSLDAWHLSEEFGSLPSLNQTFIEPSTPTARVFATPTEPDIIFDAYFNLISARPMPVSGVPGLLDHF
jgi:hypothetical protein